MYLAVQNSLLLVQEKKGRFLAQRQDDLKEMPQPALFFTLFPAKRTVCVSMFKERKLKLLITELALKS